MTLVDLVGFGGLGLYRKARELPTEVKWRIFGKAKYGNFWQKTDENWYSGIHEKNYLLHENFKQFLKERKNNIKTVLEVGCGAGIYPIKNKELLPGMSYTGIDISKTAIEYCKKNSSFEFICGDILKMELPNKFDFVFSHAVIDHVYDIDGFIKKLVSLCRKYAYINSYRGYFPNLTQHKMNWFENDACYYNDLSAPQLKKVLLESGLGEDEFIIRSQKGGQTEETVEIQTVIEINRKITF